MPRAEISGFDRTRVVALFRAGFSNHRIALDLGISRSSVIRTIQIFQEAGSVENRPRSGRPRVTDDRENRYIALFARRDRFSTSTAIRSHIQHTFRRVISTSTIRRRLRMANLRPGGPLRVQRLTRRQIAALLQWAREQQEWLLPQWRNVVFTDEVRFGLVSDDRRIRVWRELGHQQRLNLAREVVLYQVGSIMFWRGIMFNHRSPLILIQGEMTAEMYEENVIQLIIQPLRNEFGNNFIFMDDNARPHRARRVQRALERGQIVRLSWPANSSDMNPIANIWDTLARAVRIRINPPTTLNELAAAVNE
ncbi:unnamed protein product [Acanthoscelides obtectus]|uniref:Transposase n=1 Tax=Acanthoscelides obtectus TaxID=200917 RepID=A0A9P0L160_ACAOB|nr:unnamed protein product [Acanthoscelides obtectus]CAK1663141.1 Transposable element Tc1 transposase [Acanthoscelides obtectus]